MKKSIILMIFSIMGVSLFSQGLRQTSNGYYYPEYVLPFYYNHYYPEPVVNIENKTTIVNGAPTKRQRSVNLLGYSKDRAIGYLSGAGISADDIEWSPPPTDNGHGALIFFDRALNTFFAYYFAGSNPCNRYVVGYPISEYETVTDMLNKSEITVSATEWEAGSVGSKIGITIEAPDQQYCYVTVWVK